jgi:hypothetical protein
MGVLMLVSEFKFVLLKDFPTYGSFGFGIETHPNHFMLYDGSVMTLEDFNEYGCEAVVLAEIDLIFALKDKFEQLKNDQHKKAAKGMK